MYDQKFCVSETAIKTLSILLALELILNNQIIVHLSMWLINQEILQLVANYHLMDLEGLLNQDLCFKVNLKPTNQNFLCPVNSWRIIKLFAILPLINTVGQFFSYFPLFAIYLFFTTSNIFLYQFQQHTTEISICNLPF